MRSSKRCGRLRTFRGSVQTGGVEYLALIKRSDCLVFFFREERLYCKNYLTGVEVATAPIIVSVLDVFGRWREFESAKRLLPGYSPRSIRSTLYKLRRNTLLLHKGSLQAQQESLLKAWSVWGEEARFFHFITKHTFRSGVPNERRYTPAYLKRYPQPAQIKTHPRANQISLPRRGARPDSEFERILLGRRTHRHFAKGSVSLEQLSTVLDLTWGIKGHLLWPGLGPLPLKTSPSGGARHPLEVYIFALRVAGLPRGVYHYRADRQALELIRRGTTEDRLVKLCAGQDWIRGCAALFVMTAVLPRVMWRYRFSRAYRVVLLEAGHFCQTFCLVATWLGLAPFCTAAFADAKLEKELGIDGANETVLYAAGVGKHLL